MIRTDSPHPPENQLVKASGRENLDPGRKADTEKRPNIGERIFNPDRRVDSLYTDRETRMKFAEHTHCDWRGTPGDSLAIPKTDTEEGRAAAERLAEFKQNGIRYRDGVVDFSRCSLATVRIEGMTRNRLPVIENEDIGNYKRAFNALASMWNKESPRTDGKSWTAQDAKKWADSKNLTPHECSDMRTMQFVPKEIHSFFKHFGGVAECKARDKQEENLNG